jgi:putative transcriptional regulator
MNETVLMNLSNLNGAMLLAAPHLRDANFSRTVLILAAHTPDSGAYGYILNSPLGKQVADFLSGPEHEELANVEVYYGGPVAENQLTFAALRWSQKQARVLIKTQLSLREAIEQRALGRKVRAFLGYSGWTKGQLENELEARSWIVSQPQRLLLHSEDMGSLWQRLLESMGPSFALLAKTPQRPEWN